MNTEEHIRYSAGRSLQHASRSGFSLLETLIVVALVMAMGTVATLRYRTVSETLDADVAIAEVSSQMQYARQIAIGERRNVQIDFVDGSTIQVVRIDDAASTTVMSDVELPSGYTLRCRRRYA